MTTSSCDHSWNLRAVVLFDVGWLAVRPFGVAPGPLVDATIRDAPK
jgi:hypothetical protein